MSRRHLIFGCEGETLAGTLDAAPGKVGLLIVTGGNETRAGAFSGQAELAAHICAQGFPVFRFDRRGVGDSSGENRGFRSSAPDISAALTAFREAQPDIERTVALGNCDAASALMLCAGSGADALVLANPWTFDSDDDDGLAPPEAIRSRYIAKLKNPREVLRLFTGGVSLSKLAKGLRQAAAGPSPPSSLAKEMASAMEASRKPARFLIAGSDRTGQAFMAACPEFSGQRDICADAGHSFAEPHARQWLHRRVMSALQEQARQLDMG